MSRTAHPRCQVLGRGPLIPIGCFRGNEGETVVFCSFPVNSLLGPAGGSPLSFLGFCQSRHLLVWYLKNPPPNSVPRFGDESGPAAHVGGRDEVELRFGVVGSEHESGVGGDAGDPIGVEKGVVGEIESRA